MTDPLRSPDGRFRAPTAAERLFGPVPAEPPEPRPEPRRGPAIPAGPMGTELPEGDDLIRLTLRRLRR
jgi:hypothetical protein